MTAACDFLSLTPLIPAGENLHEAVAYFTAKLGFGVVWQADGGAEVRRGAVVLHLVRNGDRHWAENCSCVIGVSDLDALFAEYRDEGLALGALEIKSWGRREFHMILPTCVCLQFHAE
jgi:hypothetical protein